jgi:acyl-CoA thioester hydrolase
MGEPFRHPLRVRFNECDVQGVVFNANYLVYLDVALTELLRTTHGSYGALIEAGVDLMLVESRVTYRAPARADDAIEIELSVGALGRTSMRIDARVLRDGDVLADAELHYVAVDPATQRKRPLDTAFRTRLEPYGA